MPTHAQNAALNALCQELEVERFVGADTPEAIVREAYDDCSDVYAQYYPPGAVWTYQGNTPAQHMNVAMGPADVGWIHANFSTRGAIGIVPEYVASARRAPLQPFPFRDNSLIVSVILPAGQVYFMDTYLLFHPARYAMQDDELREEYPSLEDRRDHYTISLNDHQRWHVDNFVVNFWHVVSGLPRPPQLPARLPREDEAPAAERLAFDEEGGKRRRRRTRRRRRRASGNSRRAPRAPA
jgi:hypothetical protein